MYISYSGYKSNEQCPLSYWHRYVNKTVLTAPDNGVNALYGIIIGTVFEIFYRDRIWKHVNYVDKLQDLVESVYLESTKPQKGRIIDWGDERSNYASKEALLVDVRDSIPRGIDTIRRNRLVGRYAEAEVKLDTKFGEHLIGGRADFLIQRVAPDGDLVLLDGKGSKHRDKYVDGHAKKAGKQVEGVQLKWYAFLHRAKLNRAPDQLGYIFWRFDGDAAMEWIPFTKFDLDQLQHEVLSTVDRVSGSIQRLAKVSGKAQEHSELLQELFPAQPGWHCSLCSYLPVCEEGSKKVASIQNQQRKPRPTLPRSGVLEDGLSLDEE